MANEYQSGVNLRGTGTGPQGNTGAPGATPYIGPNGNWWINGVDTGTNATFSASDIMVAGDNNELLKYNAALDKLVPSGAYSPSDGELVASTNSIYLGQAHSMTSAGRNVALRNLFTGQSFSPITTLLDSVQNPGPTWRKYTDSGMTEVTLESVSTAILTDPMFSTGATFDRRTFSGEIIPSEDQAELWFEVMVGSVQVWRANLGPVTGGQPLQFYMADFSAPYDLRNGDTVYVRIRGKVRGNSTTGRAYLRAWYRQWAEVRLLDANDLATLQGADSSETAARILGDQQQQSYTDSAVASEATLRQSGDAATLSSAKTYADGLIASEVTARNNAITAAIATEVTNRNSAITSAVNSAIATEVTNRNNAISAAIATEVTNRNTAISNAIASEVTARDAAIATSLASAKTYTDTQVAAEATSRTNGDAATLASANAYTDARAMTPGAMVSRTLAFATAYQASAPTKPAWVSAMVEATYTVTLASTQSDTVELRMGPVAADAVNGTGASVVVASWRSSLTGIALVIGMATADRGQLSGMLPIGWYFALRRTAGTAATIISAVDQPMRA